MHTIQWHILSLLTAVIRPYHLSSCLLVAALPLAALPLITTACHPFGCRLLPSCLPSCCFAACRLASCSLLLCILPSYSVSPCHLTISCFVTFHFAAVHFVGCCQMPYRLLSCRLPFFALIAATLLPVALHFADLPSYHHLLSCLCCRLLPYHLPPCHLAIAVGLLAAYDLLPSSFPACRRPPYCASPCLPPSFHLSSECLPSVALPLASCSSTTCH